MGKEKMLVTFLFYPFPTKFSTLPKKLCTFQGAESREKSTKCNNFFLDQCKVSMYKHGTLFCQCIVQMKSKRPQRCCVRPVEEISFLANVKACRFFFSFACEQTIFRNLVGEKGKKN